MDDGKRRKPGVVAGLLAGMVGLYRWYVSPMLPGSCIYTPTCSEYAQEALKKFGALRGSWMAVKRISRCNPFHEGGYDPVPEVDEEVVPTDEGATSAGIRKEISDERSE